MRHTVADFRRRGGGGREGKRDGAMAQMVRRFLFSAINDTVSWLVDGFVDDAGNVEQDEVETFQGLGDYQRPVVADRNEIIILKVGADSGHGTAVAFRNVDALRRYIDKYGDIEAGERALYSDAVTRILFKDDDTIHAEKTSGGAVRLALHSDVLALQQAFDGHAHGGVDTGVGTTAGPDASPGTMVGTTIFKAE